MPEKKKHHFVPRFYLRNFSSNNSIALFRIKSRRFIPNASIKGQCTRDYLYGGKSEIEDALGLLEGEAARIIRGIIGGKDLPRNDTQDFISLLIFICLQMGRSPQAGEEILDMMTKTMRTIFRKDSRIGDHVDQVKLTHKNPTLYAMAMKGQLAIALHDLRLALIHNDSEVGFITSDSPAILFNQWAQEIDFQGVLGLACSGIQVFFPLSPKHLLILFDGDIYSVKNNARLWRRYSVHGLNAIQLTRPVDNIYFDGSPDTLSAIHKLPFNWQEEARDSSKVKEALSVNKPKKESLIHTYRRIVGRLNVPEIRIRKSASSIPKRERGNRYRRDSVALARLQNNWIKEQLRFKQRRHE